jgi:hypothetical protein
MATTTPNFGWSVPTSSDLVKNGATAIETLGDSIDASLVDLKGGTTGQVLSKATNTDMDFSWIAAGGASGLTLITAQSFTTASSVNVNSCFSSTYQNYLIQIIVSNTSAASDAFLRLRASGTDASGNDYKWAALFNHSVTVTASGAGSNSASAFSDYFIGYDSSGKVAMTATMFRPFEATSTFITSQSVSSPLNSSSYNYARTGVHSLTNSYDGFSLTVNSGTITGNLRVYGLANS